MPFDAGGLGHFVYERVHEAMKAVAAGEHPLPSGNRSGLRTALRRRTSGRHYSEQAHNHKGEDKSKSIQAEITSEAIEHRVDSLQDCLPAGFSSRHVPGAGKCFSITVGEVKVDDADRRGA